MDWQILGHEWAVELLSQQLIGRQVSHAYLFCGPEGVGRRMLALRLAQALNCTNPPQAGQPCLSCSTCTRLEQMKHPDLVVVRTEPGSTMIKVEQVREVQHNLALVPYEATYKIALFLNLQDSHPSALNAMLKTLEEPPNRVIILLTADDPDNLLSTITSRCEIIRLRPLPVEVVEDGLQHIWGIFAEQAQLLAHISGGLPAVALKMKEQPEMLDQRRQWLDDFYNLLSASRLEKFSFAQREIKENRETVPIEIRTWISLWRDVVLVCSGNSIPMTNIDFTKQVHVLADRVDFTQACQIMSMMENMVDQIEHSNINLQLALETMLLAFPHLRLNN